MAALLGLPSAQLRTLKALPRGAGVAYAAKAPRPLKARAKQPRLDLALRLTRASKLGYAITVKLAKGRTIKASIKARRLKAGLHRATPKLPPAATRALAKGARLTVTLSIDGKRGPSVAHKVK